jgi:hypothetical protein
MFMIENNGVLVVWVFSTKSTDYLMWKPYFLFYLQFFITCGKCDWLDNKHVVFGVSLFNFKPSSFVIEFSTIGCDIGAWRYAFQHSNFKFWNNKNGPKNDLNFSCFSSFSNMCKLGGGWPPLCICGYSFFCLCYHHVFNVLYLILMNPESSWRRSARDEEDRKCGNWTEQPTKACMYYKWMWRNVAWSSNARLAASIVLLNSSNVGFVVTMKTSICLIFYQKEKRPRKSKYFVSLSL